jgi:hypothetical protein
MILEAFWEIFLDMNLLYLWEFFIFTSEMVSCRWALYLRKATKYLGYACDASCGDDFIYFIWMMVFFGLWILFQLVKCMSTRLFSKLLNGLQHIFPISNFCKD